MDLLIRDGRSPAATLAAAVTTVTAASCAVAGGVVLVRVLSGAIPRGSLAEAIAAAVLGAAAMLAAGLLLRGRIRPSGPRLSVARLTGASSPVPITVSSTVIAGRPDRPPTTRMPSPVTPTSPWTDAKLVQRIDRYERVSADGACVESAVGRVVARFAEGARSASVHVGFCPPFVATPVVTVSTECDGLEVVLSAAEVLPWGVRIEGRLEEPAEEPMDVEIDLVAVPPMAA